MKALLTVAAVAGLLAITVTAWGPSSHYYFTCTASDIPLDECLTQANEDLLSGTEMPDAFGFVNLLSPLGAPVPCQGWELLALHSPLFAGYLYREAPQYNSATFNATAFAVGFGMHVSADAAGFFNGGYLGYGWGHGYTPLVNNTANWLGLWPFMSAVDAHVYNAFFSATGTHLPRRGVPSTSLETANFVVSTVKKAIADGAQFPSVDTARVQQCATAWQSMVAEESIKAEATPPAAFEFVMIFNDRYNATNWNQSKSHFDKVRGCAVEAPRQWLQAMERPGATPQQAYDALKAYLVAAFFSGMCTP